MRSKSIIRTCTVIALVLAMLVLIAINLMSCGNYQMFDTTYNFKEAMVRLPDGTIVKGEVESWLDFENCDAVQLVIDGVTYYTHLQNVAFINK